MMQGAMSPPVKWTADVVGGDGGFFCNGEEHLLQAMIRAGRTSIKVGCRNGGCGICRVRIAKGSYTSRKMTRAKISDQDEEQGIVLACRIYPQSDLIVEPMPPEPKR